MLHLEPATLRAGVRGWFTGRDPDGSLPLGAAGNLAHRRPHRPSDLARARAEVGTRTRTDPRTWHLLRQVHGNEVAVVDASVAPGTELDAVDAAVTDVPGRVLVVQVADCVPVLLAGRRAIGVAHAGRLGVELGVVARAVDALVGLGEDAGELHAAIGPGIGGCCYEVPAGLQAAVVAREPTARATTTWGTPSLDLPAAVAAQLRACGVERLTSVDGCTRCDPQQRWLSHRADPSTGRQVGLVVRDGPPEAAA